MVPQRMQLKKVWEICHSLGIEDSVKGNLWNMGSGLQSLMTHESNEKTQKINPNQIMSQ